MKHKEVSKYKFLRDHSVVIDLLTIAFLWCLAVILVNPYGEFPLNDDWQYSTAVKRLLEEGVFRPTQWGAMTLISQTLWGALFSTLFGFSFTVLRFSTLFLALIGIFGFYLLLRLLESNRWLAVTAALVFTFNPIYFALSHTFMTDVPFTTCTVLALLFFFRSLLLESDINLFIGTCFAVAAILCRQLGLFLPIAFCLTLFIKHGFSMKWFLRASFPVIMGFGALAGFEYWMEASDALSASYSGKTALMLQTLQSPKLLFTRFVNHAFITLLYIGLFLFPLVILLPKPICVKKWHAMCVNAVFYGFITSSSLILVLQKCIMPVGYNTLIESGIGPITLNDVYNLRLSHVPTIPSGFWMLVTAISILGGGFILARITSIVIDIFSNIKYLKDDNIKIATVSLVLGAAVYFFTIATIDWFFDRYLLPLLPLICIAIVLPVRQAGLRQQHHAILGAILSFILLLVFSIAGTRDYLTWNKTRWEALRSLVTEEHVPPSQIDGGFEFNGWHLYRPDYRVKESKSWWWVEDDNYMVAMGEVGGYEVVHRYNFSRWLPPQKGSILVLSRIKSKTKDEKEKLSNSERHAKISAAGTMGVSKRGKVSTPAEILYQLDHTILKPCLHKVNHEPENQS